MQCINVTCDTAFSTYPVVEKFASIKSPILGLEFSLINLENPSKN